ncbi:uncharacterized protein LOC143627163 [Bidens hawaiensis]|uniref:uncharacterized protein LOC143627163 n=1 Tax=Bidens hawaiensis TaxID=980011 RepID=UPI00404A6145
MAAGWNANLIVETWCLGDVVTTSIGLAVASTHTCGRHVCIVPDQESRTMYISAMQKYSMAPEVMVGDPETVVKKLDIIDFLVVDSKKHDFARVLKAASFGHRGAVVVCKNVSLRVVSDFRLRSLFYDGESRRIVRSVFLPVGNGLEVAHVAAAESGSGSGSGSGRVKNGRWIKRVDRESGEEFLIRK